MEEEEPQRGDSPHLHNHMGVLLEAYQFNFVTVASWACMLLISVLFLLNNLLRLLGKESATNLWRCDQLTQEWTERVSKSVGEVMEEGIRWTFRVSVDKEWHVFARTVVLLLVFSKVVAFFDLLSLLYTCTLVGMTVPVTYLKYEEKIKRYAEGVKARWRRACQTFDDRVVRKVKSKFVVHANKDKKVE
ncbi:unnamed protein product [Rhodiola kirilowii]